MCVFVLGRTLKANSLFYYSLQHSCRFEYSSNGRYSLVREFPIAHSTIAAEAANEQTQSGLMRYDVVKVENGKVLLRYGSTHHFHTASKRQVGVGQGMMSSQAGMSFSCLNILRLLVLKIQTN